VPWTTCPLCKGSGLNPLVPYEDDCPECDGEGGVAAEDPDEDDPSTLDDVDVQDED
jgi:hypothetical protein